MKLPEYLDVDPRTLHLPSTRPTGADPFKLQRQVAQYGSSTQGMPSLFVYRGADGGFIIFDGVTRATRVAMLRPGELVRVRSHRGTCGAVHASTDCRRAIAMTSETRRELLRVLDELSAQCPEVRFGQLMANLATLAKGPTVEALWEAEDEELLQAARQQRAIFRARHTAVAS